MHYSYVRHSREGKKIAFIKLDWSLYISDDKLSEGPALSPPTRLKCPISYNMRKEIKYSIHFLQMRM